MATPELTPDEAVETLKRSGLPTIITEGIEDYLVFRKIEESLVHLGVSLMPVGGRQTVLEVFSRRSEFPNVKVAFVVDRDMWLFCGIPHQYQDPLLVVTEGYSIENDLYRDADIEKYMTGAEAGLFSNDCKTICKWFSFAVKQSLAGGSPLLKVHPSNIIDIGGGISPAFAVKCGYTGHCPMLYPQILANYKRMLRGKTPWHLLVKVLSAPARGARHNYRSLMEVAAHCNGPLLGSLNAHLEAVMRP
jgi:hypothetical protein